MFLNDYLLIDSMDVKHDVNRAEQTKHRLKMTNGKVMK